MTISESAERDLGPHFICARFTIIFNVNKISHREFLFVSGSYMFRGKSWDQVSGVGILVGLGRINGDLVLKYQNFQLQIESRDFNLFTQNEIP